MSEFINKHDARATIRWKLLTTVSAVALTAYVSSTGVARAEDGDHPTLWIELGGQLEQMQGLSSPFTAPFMFVSPTPAPYQGVSISGAQSPPRYALGLDGKISFQPGDSDWIFSAGIRYGRSHSKRHTHHQTSGVIAHVYTAYYHAPYFTYQFQGAEAFLDTTVQSSERHLVLDFSAGKDIGIGLLGRDGSSTFSGGVRLVDLKENMSGTVYARPNVTITYPGPKYTLPKAVFNEYTMMAKADRSFNGIGPSISWAASAGIAGNRQDGELMLDWGINAAVLFGRQKAKIQHNTTATHYNAVYRAPHQYTGPVYPPRHYDGTRSRKMTTPNIGGFAGISLKWPNAKISLGYRYDTFLQAMDTGIDARKTSNLTFNGPYASISIGLGD